MNRLRGDGLRSDMLWIPGDVGKTEYTISVKTYKFNGAGKREYIYRLGHKKLRDKIKMKSQADEGHSVPFTHLIFAKIQGKPAIKEILHIWQHFKDVGEGLRSDAVASRVPNNRGEWKDKTCEKVYQ